MEDLIIKLKVHEIAEKRILSAKENENIALLVPIDIIETARIMKIEPNMGDFSVLFDIGNNTISPKDIKYPINYKDCFTINNNESEYECLKIKALRVEELEEDEIVNVTNDILYADIIEDLEDKIMIYTNVIFQGQKIYRDNPYVFYIEIKQKNNLKESA